MMVWIVEYKFFKVAAFMTNSVKGGYEYEDAVDAKDSS